MYNNKPTAEKTRLEEALLEKISWRLFGRYLSERQWGTVREDYSLEGNAWLGVHALQLLTFRQKDEAFIEWAWDYFGNARPMQIIDPKHTDPINSCYAAASAAA